MLRIDNKSKVYIVSPYHNTGGPKSLHQLADTLVRKGIETYIVYYWNGKFTGETDILYDFCKASVAKTVIDDEKNIIIVPEIQQDLLTRFSNIRKVVWWLSLDFYLTSTVWGAVKAWTYRKRLPLVLTPIMLVKCIINNPSFLKNPKRLDNSKLKDYYHMYNCDYEKNFLEKQGVSDDKLAYLCGPLEDIFLKVDFDEVEPNKRNIVAYNPAKMDVDFLKKVKSKLAIINNNIKFVAIKNMSREQVYSTLKSAKVYIDFGYFPGPERMPREAVALYCNIITSTEGSAGNDVDVMIPREFKFNIRDKKNIDYVVDLINKMTINYCDYVKYGDKYRQKVWSQITNFTSRVSEIFEQENTES